MRLQSMKVDRYAHVPKKGLAMVKWWVIMGMLPLLVFCSCGERTDGLYGTRYSRSELEEMGIAEHRVLHSYDYTKLKNFKKEDRYMFYYAILMSTDYKKTESFMCILNKYYI